MRALTTILLCTLLLSSASLWAQSQPPAKVRVAKVVTKQVAPTTRLTGLIDFDRISEVSGEISGLITRQNVIQGDHVRKGDALVTLNSDLIEKDMDIKRQQIAQVSSDMQKVGSTLERLESLLKNNSASRQAYDDARFDYRSLSKKRETLEQEMERLDLQLEKSVVRAPFDGIILEKLKESGEWLTPGSAICRIASTEDLLVTVSLSENLIRYQTLGTQLTVTIPALDKQLTGTIRTIAPIANKRSRSVTMKVHIPYQAGLFQNLGAEVEVPAGKQQMLEWLPRDALVRRQDKEFVYSVKDGQAEIIPVSVVARSGDEVGVSSPMIKPDMPVVVSGNDRLKPKQAVQVLED